MCGIVACSGKGHSQDVVVEGLGKMQYRGYDSFGFALVTESGSLETSKSLESYHEEKILLPPSQVLLGHTRWATHGAVNLTNGHPHVDPRGNFALVHNGIVENFDDLRSKLTESGRIFITSTDTEVIVFLMAQQLAEVQLAHQLVKADLTHESQSANSSETNAQIHEFRILALSRLQKKLKGRNTLVFLFSDGHILGARQGSPLIVGQGEQGLFLASDVLAFAPQMRRCFAMSDGDIVSIKSQQLVLIREAAMVVPKWQEVDFDVLESSKDGHKHYMLKEILEQWSTIPQQLQIEPDTFDDLVDSCVKAPQVIVLGSGGAALVAKQVAWILRNIGGTRAIDIPAYEVDAYECMVNETDIVLAISQSGETADTLLAMEKLNLWGVKIACLVNMPLSTMTRSADLVFYNRCGPEECVLSTKSASAQLTFGYLLAHAIKGEFSVAKKDINLLSHQLSRQLVKSEMNVYQSVVACLKDTPNVFLLGTGKHLATAMIGALNIKEASYVHAEAFSAGELKHGVIALVEPNVPVILFIPKDDLYMKTVAAEVKTRGACVIAICESENTTINENIDYQLVIPGGGSILSAVIPCQLLAYYLAIARGVNPDRPRNLAKSVTVQ